MHVQLGRGISAGPARKQLKGTIIMHDIWIGSKVGLRRDWSTVGKNFFFTEFQSSVPVEAPLCWFHVYMYKEPLSLIVWVYGSPAITDPILILSHPPSTLFSHVASNGQFDALTVTSFLSSNLILLRCLYSAHLISIVYCIVIIFVQSCDLECWTKLYAWHKNTSQIHSNSYTLQATIVKKIK